MKNTSLIVLSCVLFHTIPTCSMDTATAITEAQVSADAQTKSDAKVPAKDKPSQEEHWNDCTIGKWSVPGGKMSVASVAAASLVVIGAVLGAKVSWGAKESDESEWAKRFKNFLKDVEKNNPEFEKQWAGYAEYDWHNQTDDEVEAQNPHDLLYRDEFIGKLNDEGIKEFVAILELLDRECWGAKESGESEWAKAFKNFLKDVEKNNPGFEEQWVGYTEYDGQNQAHEERKMPNQHDLLDKDEFIGKLNDEGIKAFIAILRLLDKELWDNRLRALLTRKEQKKLLQELLLLKSRDDVLQEPYNSRLSVGQRISLIDLHAALTTNEQSYGKWLDDPAVFHVLYDKRMYGEGV